MPSSQQQIAAVVLAAGKGVRMKSDLPKVLHRLAGKPLINHVIASLSEAGVERIINVVGYEGDQVLQSTEGLAEHVWQREQLGTGHAVMQAEKSLENFTGQVIVACGDVPLIRPETFRQMLEMMDDQVKAVVLTMDADPPDGYGRVVKDNSGAFSRIVEHKDADETVRAIKEVNTGTYVFDAPLLFRNLGGIDTDNAQGEYYLPDVLTGIAGSGFSVGVLKLEDPVEGTGVNSQEDLTRLEQRLSDKRRVL